MNVERKSELSLYHDFSIPTQLHSVVILINYYFIITIYLKKTVQ